MGVRISEASGRGNQPAVKDKNRIIGRLVALSLGPIAALLVLLYGLMGERPPENVFLLAIIAFVLISSVAVIFMEIFGPLLAEIVVYEEELESRTLGSDRDDRGETMDLTDGEEQEGDDLEPLDWKKIREERQGDRAG